MAILSAVKTPVNAPPATIDDVITWVEAQSSKADMGGASARLRATALRQIAEQVADGEPADAASVLSNIERLRERWARRNPSSQSGTAKTYASRAQATIKEYFRWASAPDKYDPKKSKVRSDEPKKSPPKKTEGHAAAPIVDDPPPPPLPPPAGDVRKCPLGAGREPFRYILPADGLQVKDALRIAYHLITICDDYDPTLSPIQLVSTALQRNE